MSCKQPGEMAIIISKVNAHMDNEILNTFHISSIENMFGFQNDNASNPRAKFVKTFLQEKHISSMT